jgi:AraC-like DNA-binding protein
MPASAVHSFADLDDFRTQIRPSPRDFLLTGKGQFSASVTKTDLVDVWTQSTSGSRPWAWHVALESARVAIVFSPTPGSVMKYGGAELGEDEGGLILRGRHLWLRSLGSTQAASVSMPIDVLTQQSIVLLDRDLASSQDRHVINIPAAAMTRLRRLHAAVTNLASTAPEIIANVHAAKGLDAALTEIFIDCIDSGMPTRGRSVRHHIAILRRMLDLEEQHAEEPLYVADICRKLGVSSRLLQRICFEQIGLRPKQYFILRRLHLARRALRNAPPGSLVTDIATRFGFWELGRFAVNYRAVFGETPSATVRR